MRHNNNKSKRAAYLDRTVPLDGASHADVLEYSVDIPMRYSECNARLADGRTVRLRNSHQFIGWSGWDGKRSFLFRSGLRRIEIQTDAGLRIGNVRSGSVGVISWLVLMISTSKSPVYNHATRKFIAPDGNQLVIRHWGQILGRRIGRQAPMYRAEILETHGLANAAQG